MSQYCRLSIQTGLDWAILSCGLGSLGGIQLMSWRGCLAELQADSTGIQRGVPMNKGGTLQSLQPDLEIHTVSLPLSLQVRAVTGQSIFKRKGN